MISSNILNKGIYTKEEAFLFFKLLNQYCPELMPEKFDQVEPYKYKFDLKDKSKLNEFFDSESSTFFKNKKKVSISIFKKFMRNLHSRYSIDYQFKNKKNLLNLIDFIIDFAIQTNTDYSFLHNYFNEEKEFAILNDTIGYNYLMVPSILLIKYIPDLYQTQIFGKSFVDEFGMDKLLSMPAPVVKKISENQIYFQLVKDINNTSYEELAENRILIKKYLGNEYFFQKEKGQDYEYKKIFKEILPEPTGTVHVIADGSNVVSATVIPLSSKKSESKQ